MMCHYSRTIFFFIFIDHYSHSAYGEGPHPPSGNPARNSLNNGADPPYHSIPFENASIATPYPRKLHTKMSEAVVPIPVTDTLHHRAMLFDRSKRSHMLLQYCLCKASARAAIAYDKVRVQKYGC